MEDSKLKLKLSLEEKTPTLLLGAGFSFGGVNEKGDELPLGNKLVELLYKKMFVENTPSQGISTGGISAPFICVISPKCRILGIRFDVTDTQNGSISLAHTGVMPHIIPASGKPPLPSNKLPRVILLSTFITSVLKRNIQQSRRFGQCHFSRQNSQKVENVSDGQIF